MDSIYEEVGSRIAELRRARGWTQERLAEEVDRNPSYLARIEVGARKATIDTLEAIARALEVPISALFPAAEAPDVPPELVSAIRGLAREDIRVLAQVARRFERRRAKKR